MAPYTNLALVSITPYDGWMDGMTSGSMGISVKVHTYGARVVVAMCDEELVGMILDHDGRAVNVSMSFYGGDLMAEDDITEIMKGSVNLNLMGPRTIALAIGLGLVEEKRVLYLGGVPHAQVFRITGD